MSFSFNVTFEYTHKKGKIKAEMNIIFNNHFLYTILKTNFYMLQIKIKALND